MTEVNEMLQGMERFRGVFVCTTHLFDRIDRAALRRFTFKIQFKPLKAEQRERMFVTEALGGQASRLTTDARGRLARLDRWCPGDFAAVKRQIDILGEAFSEEDFLAQLEAEHRIKPEVRDARGMGFVQQRAGRAGFRSRKACAPTPSRWQFQPKSPLAQAA